MSRSVLPPATVDHSESQTSRPIPCRSSRLDTAVGISAVRSEVIETGESPIRSLTIEPAPREWCERLTRLRGGRLSGRWIKDWQRESRRELFGQAYGRLIMTGHQAEWFHPGILARFFALEEAGERFAADAIVELIVDQDINDPLRLAAPIQVAGTLTVADISLLDPAEGGAAQHRNTDSAKPTGQVAPVSIDPSRDRLPLGAPLGALVDNARDGLFKMRVALHAQQKAPNLALQVWKAAARLRAGVDRVTTTKHSTDGPAGFKRETLSASRMCETTLWSHLLDLMRADPHRMRHSYNNAVAESSAAGIAPLAGRGDQVELPLWRIDANGRRHPAWHSDLDDADIILWPRALMMTGFARFCLCDLFIHGLGGAAYDRITEQWWRDWLKVELAPMVTVSATMWLSTAHDRKAVDDDVLARAKWRLHHLYSNLDRHLKDFETMRQKDDLLATITSSARRSAERKAAFNEIHRLNALLIEINPQLIQRAKEQVNRFARLLRERDITQERTWPFPWFGKSDLVNLRRLVGERFHARQAADAREDSSR